MDAMDHVEKGMKYASQMKYEEAIRELNKAVKLDDRPGTRIILAAVYGLQLGGKAEYFDEKTAIAQKALPALDRAVEALKRYGNIPNFPYTLEDFYVFRHLAHIYLRDPEKALNDITRSIGMNPGNPGYLTMRGGIYLDWLNSPEKAFRDFQRASEIQPSADVYLFMAWCFIDLKDFEGTQRYVHLAALMDIDVLDLEREGNDFRENQWKMIRSKYIPYLNRK